jgi:nucleotide-binding universal stress UspA family protein
MKVLLAIADQEFGAAITKFACQHKWPEDTEFRVLHIIEWTPPERELTASQTLAQYLEDRHHYACKVSSEAAAELKKAMPKASVEEIVMEGSPVQRIIASASAWKADMIVLGSHGRKGISLFILGSVSLGVVSNASCSVVVIRKDDETEQQSNADKLLREKAQATC